MMRHVWRFSGRRLSGQEWNRLSSITTTGWEPTCTCDAGEPVPAVVLDCFAGSCTTLMVAQRLGRVGWEWN